MAIAQSDSSLHVDPWRRLRALLWALLGLVALIMALIWGVLQVQVTLAGFLNSESIWSKAQKQAVIDLDRYAQYGQAADLAAFRRDYRVLELDRWGRDAIIAGGYDKARVHQVFLLGNIMPAAEPGMTFVMRHLHALPHVESALGAWRSTDASVAKLDTIAGKLQAGWSAGSLTSRDIARQRERISEINAFIEPRSNLFALEVVNAAVWFGRVLFWAVFIAMLMALLLWLRMARRVIARIRNSEDRYHLLFDSAAVGIVMLDDGSGCILDANPTAVRWSGHAHGALIGTAFNDFFKAGSTAADAAVQTGQLRTRDGRALPVEVQSSHTVWGKRSVHQAIIRDISERIAMESERRIAAEALAGIAEGVIIADARRQVIAVNAASTDIGGYAASELIGRPLDEHRSQSDGQPLAQSVWAEIDNGNHWQGEVLSRRRDGSVYPERISISAIRDSTHQVQHYVAVFTNNYATKARQRHLRYLATHDALTAALNRAEFERRCAAAIEAAARRHGTVAVLFIDLDAFKIVNDSYSHAIGDRLLTLLVERMTRQLSEHDVIGRIGGDEFTVLLGNLGVREDADGVARRLLATLSEPVLVDDYEIVLSASIGVAGYPLDGLDVQTLIANADAAMYVAKTEERNTVRFYTPMMHADARRRLGMASELRHALANDEFVLNYQPSVELRSGRIVAVEALLRWQHPEHGEIMPDQFIPVAEALGLIRRIDEWVLQAVVAQMEAWDRAQMPPLRVAVNVSAHWFGHSAFVEGFNRILQSRPACAQRLLLEITESAMLRQGDNIERTMRGLQTLGIGVAVDDFGTGYSSMAYLKLPAVTYLKIDRSFVTDLPNNSNDAAILKAILAMAKSLGLQTIAEGIETDPQHRFLLDAGCAEGQGYLYSHPLPPAALEHLLLPRPRPPSARLQLVPPRRPGS